jgi:hypothetical protein
LIETESMPKSGLPYWRVERSTISQAAAIARAVCVAAKGKVEALKKCWPATAASRSGARAVCRHA